MRLVRTSLVFLALAWPAGVLAADGVLEINQTCAAAGCFSGDSAGLPVTLQTAGSYRLTSNLLVPDANTDGLVVSAHGVSIDLNGFEIRGPVTCSGSPPVCTPSSGSGSGIETTTNGIRGVSVRNGVITGMGNYGVFLGDQAKVTALRVRNNRTFGISVNSGSAVSDNVVSMNGGSGIYTAAGSIVSGNAVVQNGSYGISAGFSSAIHENVARFNGIDGINALDGSTVAGNTTASNSGDGIEATGGSTVQRTTSRSNTGFGLRLASDAGYRENTISNNSGGTVTGGVNMGNNSCNGATFCP
jgi:hypothetical protein